MGLSRFPTRARFILLAVVFAMLETVAARAEKPAMPTGGDLIATTRAALEKNSAIRTEDKQKILAILRVQFAAPNAPALYNKMSESRRRRMAEEIQQTIDGFPIAPFDTELQRHYQIETLRHGLNSYFIFPICERDPSPELPAQFRELEDLLCTCLAARYERFFSCSAVAEQVHARVREDFSREMGDDMVPTYKVPIPPSEFRALKQTVQNDFDSLWVKHPPLPIDITGRWDAMTAQQQDKYIATHTQELSRELTWNLIPIEAIIRDAYTREVYAKVKRIPLIDWDTSDRLSLSPKEVAAHRDLEKRAHEEMVILQKQAMEKANADFQKKVKDTMQHQNAPPDAQTAPSVIHESN
ncbi:MAG TPA: hypothetical protein VH592_09930 [Gemmataceae bacterium]|jgi:hypothetical protein